MQWLLGRSLFVIKFCSPLWHYIFRLGSNLAGSLHSFTRKKRLRQQAVPAALCYIICAPVFPRVCDYRIHLVVRAIPLTLKLLEFLRCGVPVSSTLAQLLQYCVNGLSLQWMHPRKMLFSAQNITCEVAYFWLVSNRLRLNNDSAGSHIKGGR